MGNKLSVSLLLSVCLCGCSHFIIPPTFPALSPSPTNCVHSCSHDLLRCDETCHNKFRPRKDEYRHGLSLIFTLKNVFDCPRLCSVCVLIMCILFSEERHLELVVDRGSTGGSEVGVRLLIPTFYCLREEKKPIRE